MDRTLVNDIMTTPAVVIPPNTTVPAAIALMSERRVRHLPVVDNGRLVGIVSRGDLREASFTEAINADLYELNFLLHRLTVDRLMSHEVVTITPEAPIIHAAELMTERKIAGLPVVDSNGSVIGMVTEADLLRLLVRKLRGGEQDPPK